MGMRYVFYILFFAFTLFIARPSFSDTGGWAATYGGADEDKAYSIQQTSDGGYIVAGWTRSFGAGEADVWVLRLRPDGQVEWQKTYGGAEGDGAWCIQQTSDGGYIIAGNTNSFSDKEWYEAWVLKLRPDGTVEWQKTYKRGSNWLNRLRSIQQTRDGGYITAGDAKLIGEGKFDILVLKLRPDGSISSSCELMEETDIAGIFSNTRITNTTASPVDSNALPQDTSATVQDTDASVNILCPSTTVKP